MHPFEALQKALFGLLMIAALAHGQQLIELPTAKVCRPFEVRLHGALGFYQPYSTSHHTEKYQVISGKTGFHLLTDFEIGGKLLSRQSKLGLGDAKKWYGTMDVKLAVPFAQFMETPYGETRWPSLAIGVLNIANDKYVRSYAGPLPDFGNDVTYFSGYWVLTQDWRPTKWVSLSLSLGSGNHWFSDANPSSFLHKLKGWFGGVDLAISRLRFLAEAGAGNVNLGCEVLLPSTKMPFEWMLIGNLYRMQVFSKALDNQLTWIGIEHERFRLDAGLQLRFENLAKAF